MEVEAFRKDKAITVKGRGVPKPLFHFEEAGFPGTLQFASIEKCLISVNWSYIV